MHNSRRHPIFHVFVEQFPPNEGGKIKRLALEANLYKFLRYDCNIAGILDVAMYEESGTLGFVVIRLKKTHPNQPWQALNCAAGYSTSTAKFLVAVDEDINSSDINAVIWAMNYRCQPHLDCQVTRGKLLGLDPSAMPPGQYSSGDFAILPPRLDTSAILIDATRKWDYPPISLPKKEYMEHARQIWESLGLPKLAPKKPWYGYSLGLWTQENEEEAELALKEKHFLTGEKLAQRRQKV